MHGENILVCCTKWIGNLSLVAGQTEALQDMWSRFNFPPTISFHLLFMMLLKLGNFWNFYQINTWFLQFIKKTENTTYSTCIALCSFS